jgi:hypothetical protein
MMQLRQYLNPSYAACFLWLKVLGSEIYNARLGSCVSQNGCCRSPWPRDDFIAASRSLTIRKSSYWPVSILVTVP